MPKRHVETEEEIVGKIDVFIEKVICILREISLGVSGLWVLSNRGHYLVSKVVIMVRLFKKY